MPVAADLQLGNLLGNDSDNIQWIETFVSYTTSFDKDTKVFPALTLALLKPEIRACGFFWCAHVYDRVSVVNGKPLSANPSASYPLLPLLDVDGKPATAQTPEGGADILAVSAAAKDEFPGMPSFQVNQNAAISLASFLAYVLDVAQCSGDDAFDAFPEKPHGMLGQDNPVVQGQNVTERFEVIAEQMTAEIRTSGGSMHMLGHAFAPETYVKVQWWWLTLSMVHLVGASVLLCFIAFRRVAPVFKSEIWPFILYPVQGLYGGEKEQPRDLVEAREVREQTTVRLGEGRALLTAATTTVPVPSQ
ncbi:hypothetical protein NLG97_g2462 [Lecanicillium saksenae]|uniref:Uncharacterized protein n=1 Tax=Lecanicillium saksenae TaxID=468837 RepID=A0ACC1R292_9HYPO|nr:hypothetical protein NLG97_g2462 [Lecanicillium saksenae]